MRRQARFCLELLCCAGAVLGGAWLLLRFVLPGLAPFLLAGLLALLTEPAVRALTRLRLRRTAAAAVVTLALLALLLFLSARLGNCRPFGSYTHVLVDEAQDLCPAQHKTLRLLFPKAVFTVLAVTSSPAPAAEVQGSIHSKSSSK